MTIALADGVAAHDVLTEVYVDGNSVIVKAYSTSGQHLKCTMPDGEFCTGQSKTDKLVYTFTISDITENTTATIGYANLARWKLVSPENAGNVEIEGLQYSNYYFEGETFKHTAIPHKGYYFVNWQDQYGNILCESEEYTFRPSSKVDVIAVFQKSCTLEVFVSPSFAGGVSAFDYDNIKGTEITLTTTPCGNSEFIGWKDKDGNILSDEKTYTFTIDSDTVIIADYFVDCGTDALDGIFTVAADNGYGKPKKVRFSRGNLRYDNGPFIFEGSQTGFASTWEAGQSSHFFWSKDATVARQRTYSDPQTSVNDVFFTNSENFSVNGVSAWYTLSSAEWSYLLGSSTERSGKHKIGVTIGGTMGLVIAPDDFEGTINSTYGSLEWIEAEKTDNLVFLPAAGRRDAEGNVFQAGKEGDYWTSSTNNEYSSIQLFFNAVNIKPSDPWIYRHEAYSIRLVTDVK